jgi:hypothetical protein
MRGERAGIGVLRASGGWQGFGGSRIWGENELNELPLQLGGGWLYIAKSKKRTKKGSKLKSIPKTKTKPYKKK